MMVVSTVDKLETSKLVKHQKRKEKDPERVEKYRKSWSGERVIDFNDESLDNVDIVDNSESPVDNRCSTITCEPNHETDDNIPQPGCSQLCTEPESSVIDKRLCCRLPALAQAYD